MEESRIILTSMLIYLASWVAYLVHGFFRNRRGGTLADLLVLFGLLVHTFAIGFRWVVSHKLGIGYVPLSNLYESMVFFSWTMALVYLIAVQKLASRILGVFVMPLVLIALASTSLMSDTVRPLVPALQSNWLTIHVVTCFLGYASFAVAFSANILYLIKVRKREQGQGWLQRHLPEAGVMDEFSYRIIGLGFPMMSLGIITGAAWANSAWGTYWSWDPKETWSLIVWLIYAAYLHARITRGWKGRRAAWLSITGFVATLFCYLGVNLLLSGLHSYATG